MNKDNGHYAHALAIMTAKKLYSDILDLDERVSAALVGAAVALSTWSATAGSSQRSWIISHCRWAILEAIRAECGRRGYRREIPFSQIEDESGAFDEGPGHEYVEQEAVALVWRAQVLRKVHSLSRRRREVVLGRLSGESGEETARRLGMARGTVYTTLKQSLAILLDTF